VNETEIVCGVPAEGVIVTVAVYIWPFTSFDPVPSTENFSVAVSVPCPGDTLNQPVGDPEG
jgi:hypothetical protein